MLPPAHDNVNPRRPNRTMRDRLLLAALLFFDTDVEIARHDLGPFPLLHALTKYDQHSFILNILFFIGTSS